MGSGITAHSLFGTETLERVDTIEIESIMLIHGGTFTLTMPKPSSPADKPNTTSSSPSHPTHGSAALRAFSPLNFAATSIAISNPTVSLCNGSSSMKATSSLFLQYSKRSPLTFPIKLSSTPTTPTSSSLQKMGEVLRNSIPGSLNK